MQHHGVLSLADSRHMQQLLRRPVHPHRGQGTAHRGCGPSLSRWLFFRELSAGRLVHPAARRHMHVVLLYLQAALSGGRATEQIVLVKF
jgi:hypothetical protein